MPDTWNSYNTAEHKGVSAEVSSYTAGNGDLLHAYVAKPSGDGPFPGIVLVHHLPGLGRILPRDCSCALPTTATT